MSETGTQEDPAGVDDANGGMTRSVVSSPGWTLLSRSMPVLGLLVAIGISLLLVRSAGVSPFTAVGLLFSTAFADPNGLGVTLLRTTPLLITAVGVAVGMHAGLFNLGGEGQIYIGGLTSTAMLLYVLPPDVGGVALITGALVAGFIGGALWIVVPLLLRTLRGVTEVITTLLMNFIAINLVAMVVQGPMGEAGASYPRSAAIPDAARLGDLIPGTQAHVGFLIALAIGVAVYVLVNRTTLGLEIRAVGAGERAARFAGIPVDRRLAQALLLSGGIAGVAGAIEIIGLHLRLIKGFSPGYGFDAIAIALLGRLQVSGMVAGALFFGFLRAGTPRLERSLGVPNDLVFVIQGLAILGVIGGYGAQRWLERRADLRQGRRLALGVNA